MKKWLLGAVATVAIVASIPTAAFAAEDTATADKLAAYYAEDSLNHWATADLHDFMQGDILAGYEKDGVVSVKPNGEITRAEFVAIVLRAADVKTEASDVKFTDVKKGDWFYDSVATASAQGLIFGVGDNRFAPNEKITRAEISAILNRFFKETIDFTGEAKQFNDIKGHWAQPDIENISKADIVAGYNNSFKPNDNATRAEASSMIRRALHKEVKAAPEEKDLIAVTEGFHKASIDLLAAQKFDELKELTDAKTTGFAHEMGLFSIDVMKSMLKELAEVSEAKVELNVSGDAAYKVIFASDRYAAVEVSGQMMETKVTIEDESKSESSSVDETYLLRKVNGEWTIYGGNDSYKKFVELMT
ncbi:S-layer homology domain-containing protein [Paenibacillus albiflavus]|uniref:S-layer homology domain-containing protein n=1 Tax=Paenibacillus albiflavus TaxID=2545760 RepID=A0A4R4EAX5_9BACL|nr:S-layer homology domain-containing protein [Paenibacillus albiflavus]TCZ77016.1 S-layer homology domain-containing protein [Paenibacillus albiflavus]